VSYPREESPFALKVRHQLEDWRGERPRLIGGKPVFPPALPPLSTVPFGVELISNLARELYGYLISEPDPASRDKGHMLQLLAQIGAVAQLTAEDQGLIEKG
jgi:hypothetical protein